VRSNKNKFYRSKIKSNRGNVEYEVFLLKKSAFQGFSGVPKAFFQRQRKQIFQALKKTPLKKILQKQSLAKQIFFLFQGFLFQMEELFFPNPFELKAAMLTATFYLVKLSFL